MSPALRLSLLLCCCPLLAAAAPAGVVSLDDLAKNSPFMPAGQTGAATTQNAVVEFRGVIKTSKGVVFGLYDSATKTGAWVTQDQKDADFAVRSYNPATGLVSVDYHGQNFNLTLAPAQVTVSVPVPMANLMPKVQTPEDKKRFEAIMAEVQRRRALRHEGGGNAAGGNDGARQGRASRRQAGGNGQ